MSKLVPLLQEGADELEELLLKAARDDAPPDATASARTVAAVKAASRGAAIAGAGAAGWKAWKWLTFATSHWFAMGGIGLGIALGIGAGVVADRASHAGASESAPPPTVARPARVGSGADPVTRPASPTARPLAPLPPSPTPSDVSAAGQTPPAAEPAAPAPGQTPPAAEPAAPGAPSRPRGPTSPPEGAQTTTALRTQPAAPTLATERSGGTRSDAPLAGLAALPPPAAAPSSLRQESMLLESVREALAASQVPQALALLDRYDAQFPSGALDEESTVLRVEALVASGRRDDARQLAHDFELRRPSSSYLPRIHKLLDRAP